MIENQVRKFAIAHVGPEGRVALREILGDVIEAESWKAARRKALKQKEMDPYSYVSGRGWFLRNRQE